MRRRKPRPLPAAIREQIEEISRQRMAAVADAACARDEASYWKKTYTDLSAAVADLRKQLEDMRRQRDRAVDQAEQDRARCERARENLARAMGWVDAKMDQAPMLEPDFNSGRPF